MIKGKHSATVEPRFNEVAGDRPNLFVKWRVRYIEVLFHTFYCNFGRDIEIISFVISRTSLNRGSLNRGSTVHVRNFKGHPANLQCTLTPKSKMSYIKLKVRCIQRPQAGSCKSWKPCDRSSVLPLPLCPYLQPVTCWEP